AEDGIRPAKPWHGICIGATGRLKQIRSSLDCPDKQDSMTGLRREPLMPRRGVSIVQAASDPRDLLGIERFRNMEKKEMKDAHTSRRLRPRHRAPLHRCALARCITAALVGAVGTSAAVADHEGLPFTEPFDDAHLSDASSSTADWG